MAVHTHVLHCMQLPAKPQHPIYMSTIDAGQGDSIYIKTQADADVLIDGGNNSKGDDVLPI
ncbi:MAG: hypothetical protein IMW92_07820 [Bacillales bacterium]|nr:hypothetical protein [Bacillales bacterium]